MFDSGCLIRGENIHFILYIVARVAVKQAWTNVEGKVSSSNAEASHPMLWHLSLGSAQSSSTFHGEFLFRKRTN